MNSKVRKILSVIIIAVVIIGWSVSIFGAGPIKPIKEKMKYGLDINGGVYVVMEADTDLKGEELKQTMDQTRAVLNNRVNAMGISEATVSLEGNKRLRVEMPGVDNAEEAISQIGKTAKMRFLLADGTEVLTGTDVKDAGIDTDNEHGGYKITLKFTKDGAQKFAAATTKASSGQVTSMNENIASNAVIIMLDDDIVTAPSCDQPITSPGCDITSAHGYTKEEASNTAALIRGGALPVTLTEQTSSVQSASIGTNALEKSITAGAIGLLCVFILMIIAYGLIGFMADIALALYVLIVLWIMAGMGAVLTLPGIAGIILSIGMAVDANVIIFARIKEEIGKGKTIRVAVSEGFRHALVTVLDAQITTLIASVVLYQIGSTVVKGFAITLMIGIAVSIFTAVVISQILIGLIAESPKLATYKNFGCDENGKPKKFFKKKFKFIEKRKIAYVISTCIIVAGLVTGVAKGYNYGIDFTGGTMMQVDMHKKVSTAEVEKSLKPFKMDPSVIGAGQDGEEVIIKTIKALDNDDRVEVMNKLNKDFGVDQEKDLISGSQFGPTVGKELKLNAVKSVLIAAIGMLIYIILRFKSWKYGVSSIIGVLHDVLIMLSIYAIFQITVDNPFIAAILTVVGYSINDTIVIFDRIRENKHLYKRNSIEENIDKSVNQTIDRSLMTSLTTFACMVPMVILVSTSVREFVIPLMIGVFVGTYSSIFLCSPLFYEFSKNEGKTKYQLQQEANAKKNK